MTPQQLFSISLHVNQDKGGHVRFVMFMGSIPGPRPRSGELVLTKDEFLVFLESMRLHPQVEEVSVTYMGAGNSFEEAPDDSQTSH